MEDIHTPREEGLVDVEQWCGRHTFSLEHASSPFHLYEQETPPSLYTTVDSTHTRAYKERHMKVHTKHSDTCDEENIVSYKGGLCKVGATKDHRTDYLPLVIASPLGPRSRSTDFIATNNPRKSCTHVGEDPTTATIVMTLTSPISSSLLRQP